VIHLPTKTSFRCTNDALTSCANRAKKVFLLREILYGVEFPPFVLFLSVIFFFWFATLKAEAFNLRGPLIFLSPI